jgi:hypothetical protein
MFRYCIHLSVLCCRVLRKAEAARHWATGHSTSKARLTDASKGEGRLQFAGKQPGFRLGGTCSQAWTRQDSKGKPDFYLFWKFQYFVVNLCEVLRHLLHFFVFRICSLYEQALLGLAVLRFWGLLCTGTVRIFKTKIVKMYLLSAKSRKLKYT